MISSSSSSLSLSTLRRLRAPIAIASSRSLHEGPDTIDELLDRHLAKEGKNRKKATDEEEDELSARRRLTSTRREALSLYRDILRASRFFVWPDPRGVPWRDVLRDNARREFEEARFERDPEVVTRLLIGGRDAVQAALDKLVETHRRNMEQPPQRPGDPTRTR